MGSYCVIKFDDLEIDTWKSTVPDFMISLFQENERLSFPDNEYPEEDWTKTIYQASREDVLLRLNIMGITAQKSKEAFEIWLKEEREMYAEWVANGSDWAKKTHDALVSFSLEEWMRRAPQILQTRYGEDNDNGACDEIERRMRDGSNNDWLFFETCDARFNYRLLLEACPNLEKVTLDISDLIMGGYLEEGIKLCLKARAPDAIERPVLEPVVMMGEGKTDIRALQSSLQALYPSVREMFSFFDHDTLSVDGGASFLLKFLKALSAAKMPLRVIAIFDNDGAGRQEFERAQHLALPSNITVMCLPDIQLARSYPTIGPQGEHHVDINGRAVGIELFMGQHNLTEARNSLPPIRWTHYYSGTDTYHGEIAEKAAIQDAFFRDIESRTAPEEARTMYLEFDQLWQAVFAALH